MPRRYGADGTRLWNGKTPEEFTEADAYRFMAETEAVLQRKELMDDPAQPAPASGKEEFYLSKKDDVLLTPEQIAAEERRWLFDAPIAELAEVKGVSIDEAVKMRTDAVLQEAVVPITVSVRPIEPQGKFSTENMKMAQSMGYQTFFWSLAYVDWYQDNQPTHEEAFQKLTGRIHPGAIVLLHSTSKTNAEILDELLTKWEEMGYTIKPLSEIS